MIGSQCVPVFAMLLSMVSSFRIQAVRASFLGFPGRQKPLVELLLAAMGRWAKSSKWN